MERPAFGRIAAAAHPGDVQTVSELFRLCRDLIDIHLVRDWCQARGVALSVLSGPLSNFQDLAASAPTTVRLIPGAVVRCRKHFLTGSIACSARPSCPALAETY
ncbi:recombinase family protein [Actinomadura sp. LOL_016]|uniref:recombinase family protein n=1 Tax=unclassified Actinomadura TaxID=2626254 RepID=UPI003A811632